MKNEIIHIMVTSLCNRNCKYCCNKQYDLNGIPYVTDEELRNAHTILLTGGEPFVFANPPEIARYYKRKYPNIKAVYVYSNAFELNEYLRKHYGLGALKYIDGVSVSIKCQKDKAAFDEVVRDSRIEMMNSNWLFVFNGIYGGARGSSLTPSEAGNFKIIYREWQEHFRPSPDSIFRRA